MKPTADATVVFHSSQASVWQALAASLADAGLAVTAASILDKTQASFKQVNGHTAVSGDPLLRVRKRLLSDTGRAAGSTMSDLVTVTSQGEPGRLPATPRQQQHRFSELVGMALVGGVPITMDAREVYEVQGRV